MTTRSLVLASSCLLLLFGGGVVLYIAKTVVFSPPLVETVPIATTTITTDTKPASLEPAVEIIGQSVEGRSIEAYSFSTGSTTLLFIGGIHGGYEWNSVLLAYDIIDSLRDGEIEVAENMRAVVIPNLNPDGVFKVIGKSGRFTLADVPKDDGQAEGRGRFNAHGIDLNRNFACRWQPTSKWRGKTVSAGSTAFSEPEAAALRDYVNKIKPTGVVFWHSQANAVYGSECGQGILEGTDYLLYTYTNASGYQAIPTFDAYPVSGDAEGWLASIGIPAITVELSSHTLTDWQKNLAAVKTVLGSYMAPGETEQTKKQ